MPADTLPPDVPATLQPSGPKARLARVLRGLRPRRDGGGASGKAGPAIRHWLAALVLAVVLPATLILALSALQGWTAGRAATERSLAMRAEALAASVSRELELSRAILETLAASPALAAGDLEAFRRQLDAVPRPESARIVLSDGTGQMRVNSLFPYGTPLPKRGELEVVRRVFETGLPQVSDLYVGPMTRDHLVAVDVPVRDAGGQVVFSLTMGFKAEGIGRVLAEQRLPEGWTASVLDRRQVIVARSRAAERFVGRPANAASRGAILAGRSPFETTTQEGATARAAHAPVPWAGWTVVVAVPQTQLDAPLRRSLAVAALSGGALLLFGLLVAAGLARRIARAVAALAEGAAALGRGGAIPPVPPGMREAGRAGAALREAAERLARHGRERDEADRRRALVVAELNHRVKNMLATVQSIAAQTARGDPARFSADFGARLRSLARAHDLLTERAWEPAGLAEVVRAALAPWLTGGGEAAVHLDIACAARMPHLAPGQVQAVVLAMHELATNAVKHGALSRPGGRVVLTCRCGEGEPGGVLLLWTESGGPPVPGPPVRSGFGSRLLRRGLSHDLGPGAAVELEFHRDGLRAAIRFRSREG